MKTNTFYLVLNSIHKIVISTLNPYRCDRDVSLNGADQEMFWSYLTMHALQTEARSSDLGQQ